MKSERSLITTFLLAVAFVVSMVLVISVGLASKNQMGRIAPCRTRPAKYPVSQRLSLSPPVSQRLSLPPPVSHRRPRGVSPV